MGVAAVLVRLTLMVVFGGEIELYRPSLKSGWSLILLFVFAVSLYVLAQSAMCTSRPITMKKSAGRSF